MIQRNKIDKFEKEFESLHKRAIELIEKFPEDRLFEPTATSSFGFELIRSAAEVEKAFGGITTRLWDDPFEWTLPEELSDKPAINNYLEEVRSTRLHGFKFLKNDDDLNKLIPAPEKFQSIAEILRRTIELSKYHLQRAARPLDLRKSYAFSEPSK